MAKVYWVDGDVVWVDGDVIWVGRAIAVQGATHAHGVDSVALTQKHTLAVNDATHAHSADSFDLSICIAPATHAHSADNVSLTQVHTLVVQGATNAHSVDNVLVAQQRLYGIDTVQASIVREIKDIIQDTDYGYDDILSWMNEAQSVIAGGVFVVFRDRTQVFSSPLETLETSGTVTTTSSGYADMPSDYQRDMFYIYNETTGIQVNIIETFERMVTGDPVMELSGDTIEAVIRGEQLFYRNTPDSAQTLTVYYFRKPKEMATYTSTGISFSGTTISDSNNGLGVFYAGQTMDLTGSNKNRGKHVISAVASDGSTMTVSAATTTESAGDSITIRSRPDGIPDYLQSDLISSYVAMRYFQRRAVSELQMTDFATQYTSEFYDTMIDAEAAQQRTRRPVRMVANG